MLLLKILIKVELKYVEVQIMNILISNRLN